MNWTFASFFNRNVPWREIRFRLPLILLPHPCDPGVDACGDVVGLRLQGFEEGGPKNQWIGYSQFLPGGGVGPDSTPFEKIYVVLEGEMTVIIDGKDTVLAAMDSCTIAPNVVREIVNRFNHVCKMLVVIPYPPKQPE